MTSGGTSLYYTNELQNYIIEKNSNSEIVIAQKDKNYSILTGEKFENDVAKNQMLLYFGAPKILQKYCYIQKILKQRRI